MPATLQKRTVRDVQCDGQSVLIRVDFNVPLDGAGRMTDDTRIRASLPTIEHVLSHGGRPILMSHLGRPKGRIVESLRLQPAAIRLEHLLGRSVAALDDCVGVDARGAAGDVVLLENLRFHPEEEANDPVFAKALAAHGDIYVNDAFGSAHRAHASTEGVAHLLPAVAGLLMERELAYLGRALTNPEHPFVAVLGGAKVSDKIGVVRHLASTVDAVVIGGGMAYTFLKAVGHHIGSSKLEEDKLALAQDTLSTLHRHNVRVCLPVDHIIAQRMEPRVPTQTTTTADIPDGWSGFDVGPRTVQAIVQMLAGAKTVVWNGPVGVFEIPAFAEGTRAVAQALAALDGTTIIGGGDTVAAVEQFHAADQMTHISTGGGASLEFLEGRALPGVEVLQDA